MKNLSKSKARKSQMIIDYINNYYAIFYNSFQKIQKRQILFYKSKKAVVEVQFGWIFVIIVGSLILLFFISVVKSTTNTSSEAKYTELKSGLNSMMSQSEVDVGTTRTIGIPAISLSFNCSGFSIQDSTNANANQFPYKTFFSPDLIKGREIITYSKYWAMPYSVDYFVYVTSKEVRYNFINNTLCSSCKTLLSNIIKELPANITYQVVNSAGLVTENNYYKERFIFFNQNPETQVIDSSINLMNDDDVTAINISGNTDYLKISYFKKDKPTSSFKKSSTSSYLGFPMLLGAIISESSLYECNVNKSLNKFRIITKLYQNRTIYLRDYYDFPNYADTSNEYERCYFFYNRINLGDTLTKLSFSNPFNWFESIKANAAGLEKDNQELMVFSCPMIY